MWDLSFPGIFIIHRVALEIFGPSIVGFRIFDFLVQLSSISMIFALTRKLSGSSLAGFLAAVLYGIYYYGLANMGAGQREAFIFWLILASLSAIFSGKGGIYLEAILPGLMLGFAFTIKPFYGLCWAAAGLFIWLTRPCPTPERPELKLTVFSLACLAPSAAIFCYYGSIHQLRALYDEIIWFNFAIYSRGGGLGLSRPEMAWYVIRKIVSEQPLIFFASLPGIYALILSRHGERRKSLLALAMALVTLVAYLLQGKYFRYHLIPFWGILAIFSGAGLSWTAEKVSGLAGRRPGRFLHPALGIFVIAAMLATGIDGDMRKFAVKSCFRNLDHAYLSVLGTHADGHMAANQYLAAKYLERVMRPEDQIEFFGPYPLIPYLLEKKLPSRFCCVQHLLFLPRDGRIRPRQKQWISEYSSDVIQARPRFFLLSDNFPGQHSRFLNLSARSLKLALKEQFPQLQRFLDENYQRIGVIGAIEIYEWIKDRPEPAGSRGGSE